MISDGNKVWKPSLRFLRSGQAEFSVGSTKKELIQWNFQSIDTDFPLFSCVRCEMTGFGLKEAGYGDGMLLKTATIKAFAEAWERLILSHSRKNGVLADLRVSSSNGFAAGPTTEAATRNATNELLERHLFLDAWQSQQGWQPYLIKGALNSFLVHHLVRRRWDTRFFRITSGAGSTVLAGISQHKKFGTVFDSHLIENTRPNMTSRKLILSLVRASLLQEECDIGDSFELPEAGKPQDHARYYRHPKSQPAFDFLTTQKDTTDSILLKNLQEIKTLSILPVTQFPAVSYAYNPHWAPLNWGKQSIHGVNPFPHPLA